MSTNCRSVSGGMAKLQFFPSNSLLSFFFVRLLHSMLLSFSGLPFSMAAPTAILYLWHNLPHCV